MLATGMGVFADGYDLAAYGHYAVTYQNPASNAYSEFSPILRVLPTSAELVKNVDYQAGVRCSVRGLHITADYYHDYIMNLLSSVQSTGINTLVGAVTLNWANTVYSDVNFSTFVNPVKHLTVNLTANIQHSYYTKGRSTNGLNFGEEVLPGLPHQTVTLDALYRIFVLGGLLTPEISDQYVGAQTIANVATGVAKDKKITVM